MPDGAPAAARDVPARPRFADPRRTWALAAAVGSGLVSAAKRTAAQEPVIITDRGKPSHVLLSIEEFYRLTGQGGDLVERLAMDDDLDFEPEPSRLELRVPEL